MSKILRPLLPILLASILFAGGCARLEVRDAAGAVASVRPLVRVDQRSPLAWSPDAARLAFARQGLKVAEVATGREVSWSSAAPHSLAWSAAGLAVAYNEGSAARILIYGGESQAVFAELPVDGLIGDLLWLPDGQLLATLSRVTVFRFGANLQTFLLRWRPGTAPLEEKVGDTTLKPGTAQALGASIPGLSGLHLSPFGDEVVYTQLLDPPAFDPYLRLTLRHLDSGAEKTVGRAALASGGGLLLGDGETLLFGDGDRAVRRASTWGVRQEGNAPVQHPLPGRRLAAYGDYLFVDGHLYQGDNLLLRFPLDAAPTFSPDGDSLALAEGGRLYLVDLPLPSSTEPPGSRHLQLRALRAQGLISQDDYRQYLERDVPHAPR